MILHVKFFILINVVYYEGFFNPAVKSNRLERTLERVGVMQPQIVIRKEEKKEDWSNKEDKFKKSKSDATRRVTELKNAQSKEVTNICFIEL